MRFYETIHGVYFDDLDGFQILHNARYLLLFERTIGAFWQRLRAAPSVVVEADQWRSTYRTELDGWRYTWWEDRHDPAEGITAERILPAV